RAGVVAAHAGRSVARPGGNRRSAAGGRHVVEARDRIRVALHDEADAVVGVVDCGVGLAAVDRVGERARGAAGAAVRRVTVVERDLRSVAVGVAARRKGGERIVHLPVAVVVLAVAGLRGRPGRAGRIHALDDATVARG